MKYVIIMKIYKAFIIALLLNIHAVAPCIQFGPIAKSSYQNVDSYELARKSKGADRFPSRLRLVLTANQ